MFLAEQCLDCHQGDSAEGGLDLEGVSQGVSGGLDFSQWVRLHDRVADHEMPPPEDATIPNQEREHFLSVLSHELQALERAKRAESGRVNSRRLTNLQLERTLHDLLAIATWAKLMPDEQRVDGFTGLPESQSMSHFLLQSHLNVVDTALDSAMQRLMDQKRGYQRNYTARSLRENPKRRCRDPGDDRRSCGGLVEWSGFLRSHHFDDGEREWLVSHSLHCVVSESARGRRSLVFSAKWSVQ